MTMLNEFINFVEELFPSIKPYTKENVKQAIKQFQSSGKTQKFCKAQPFPFLSQGDIVESLPFLRFTENGEEKRYVTKGMLLSNTCDAENDKEILFAPLLPIKDLKVDELAVKNNMNYRLLYIPDADLTDYVVDLSLINSYSKRLITHGISEGILKKTLSLNSYGYYLFLTKLTIHLLRPENEEVREERIQAS
ncbi:hypothetical protein [Paenibacillus gansuensis]|uniref:Uncharacterized protein n=1 Tax=Paenibacillus gansuensis TaxID=306542 RepID=A0ABW5PGB4_9BACL